MKNFLFYLITFIISTTQGSDILVIGDSHMAGPFGRYLFDHLSKRHNVVIYGHSGSAAHNWLDDKTHLLSGGIQHLMSFEGLNKSHPNKPHWTTKVEVPKFKELLIDVSLHQSFRSIIQDRFRYDSIVIELGANDLRAITNDEGTILQSNFKHRLKFNKKLKTLIVDHGSECFWVGPPSGIKKTDAAQSVVYKMLKEATGLDCKLFDSRWVYVDVCDGVHLNCRAGVNLAKDWALKVSDFIQY
jgi:hypothetical protein